MHTRALIPAAFDSTPLRLPARAIRVALPTMASVLALSIGIGAAQAQVSGTYSIGDVGPFTNGATSAGGNSFNLTSSGSLSGPPSGFIASDIDFTPNISIVGDQLSSLAANFSNVVGGAGGGSPRLVVNFANNESLFAYFGPTPSFSGDALSLSAFSGFNLINSTNDTGIGGSGSYQTFEQALIAANLQSVGITGVSFVLDGGWLAPQSLTLNSIDLDLKGSTSSQTGTTGSDGTGASNGGNGGNANQSNAVFGSDITQTSTGGNGGDASGTGNGGNGGNGNSTGNNTGVTNATFTGQGGNGGNNTGTGNGGNGGNGTANGNIAGDITGTFNGNGGNGGNAIAGNGGNGGTGTAGPGTVTGLLPTDPVNLIAIGTGGNGGLGGGVGNTGGDGGQGIIAGPLQGISVSTANPGSGHVSLDVQQIGGNGGNGVNNASGGAAAAASVMSEVVNNVALPILGNVEVNGFTTGQLDISLKGQGGNGGNADGVGLAAFGANGSAMLVNDQTGLLATQQAASLNGTAIGIGGNGGNGTSGANGVAGGTGAATATIIGHHDVSATVVQTAGNGGGSDTGLAAFGTNEIVAPITPDAIAISLGGGNVAASSTVTAGNGGSTNTGFAGFGGLASVTNDVFANTAGGNAALTQDAKAGNGGDSNGGIAGGLGGMASSILTYLDPGTANTLTANVDATGGNGGNGLGGGSFGGDGGGAGVTATITGGKNVTVNGSMTGGNGGNTPNGPAAGNGASVTNGLVPTTLVNAVSTSAGSVNVNASLTANGGNGGTSFGTGNGGNGGDASLVDATTGTVGTGGGTLSLTQLSNAGNGGGSTGGAAGFGGNATSIISTADATATNLLVTLGATAGNGGAGLGGNTDGNTGGTARVGGLISGIDAVTINANANAGNGGDANGTGGGAQAANGTGIAIVNPLNAGAGLITGTSTGTGPVSVTATETAGNGGNATNGAFAGNGGNINLRNAIGGATLLGGTLTLSQTATAGNGGTADTQNGGNGGNATSRLILDQTLLPLAQRSSTLDGTVTANGGNGGISSGASNGSGGGANAVINLASSGIVNATANAVGGTGSSGGAANATATATGTGGLATANAFTPGNGPVFNVGAMANGTIHSTTVANAQTSIGGSVPSLLPVFAPGSAPNTFAIATGLPNAGSVTTALVAHPNNTAVWTQPTAFIAGAGLQGVAFDGTLGVSHTYQTQTEYNFNVPFGAGTLLTVGLLNGQSFGSLTGLDSLTFQITDNGIGIAPLNFSNALPAGATLGANGVITFSSLAAADAFFSDDVLTFGALTGNNTIDINLNLTAADAVGFQANFLVGTTGASGGGGGGGAGVPEPGTLAIFLSALLGWFGIRLHQRKSNDNTSARMA